MARITVEDCLEKVENQYDLVLLAKERASQLSAGAEPLVPVENDKKTVLALREIAEDKVSVKDLQEKAINKLRKYPEETAETEAQDELEDDEFHKIYKGESSKSGTPVLPSKRARKIPLLADLEENKKQDQSKEKIEKENQEGFKNDIPETDK